MKSEKEHAPALRVAHIALGCLWLLGLIGMLVSMIFPLDTPTEEKLVIFHAIDAWLVIPCAAAAALTGLLLLRIKRQYSLKKESWLFKKLIICCFVMLGGFFFVKTPLLMDLLNSLLGSSSMRVEEHTLFLILNMLAIALLFLVIHLSVAKPTKQLIDTAIDDHENGRSEERPRK